MAWCKEACKKCSSLTLIKWSFCTLAFYYTLIVIATTVYLVKNSFAIKPEGYQCQERYIEDDTCEESGDFLNEAVNSSMTPRVTECTIRNDNPIDRCEESEKLVFL